jgi:flavin reductase (DIM6/NTAB) family NADH-FMN oxidoreductase RutF
VSAETRTIVPGELAPREAYNLLLSVVVPRPIAWVSTVGADGTPNLAPFSFFNGVNGVPPVIMISIARARGGGRKDTLRNLEETGELVVHLVDEAQAEAMNLTSGEYPYEVDERLLAGLAAAPSVEVRPPRLPDAPVAMEARLQKLVPVEGTPSTLALARVLRFHIRAELLRANGLVDAAALRPVARLGGDEYATLGRVFSMARPRV